MKASTMAIASPLRCESPVNGHRHTTKDSYDLLRSSMRFERWWSPVGPPPSDQNRWWPQMSTLDSNPIGSVVASCESHASLNQKRKKLKEIDEREKEKRRGSGANVADITALMSSLATIEVVGHKGAVVVEASMASSMAPSSDYSTPLFDFIYISLKI
ncbi:hypothetical protein CRG98_040009 [Punica granatum]|uniref:Uncharacterized protein n=1 Tax=Punica granatum TaxID=22663 RepID=A0A2I0I6A3_PUNGR|nr:hypothetical protein CRG98_040009 [Punica granatum]